MQIIISYLNYNFLPGAHPLRGTTAMQVNSNENPPRNCGETEERDKSRSLESVFWFVSGVRAGYAPLVTVGTK